MSWLLSLVVSGVLSHGVALDPHASPSVNRVAFRSLEDALTASSRRIRSSERRITKLLLDGVRRSQTFADLVSRLHDTDVIVYIEVTSQLPPETVGRILMQGAAGGQRYVRVQVRALLQGDQIIAVLGHEFHHALEIAQDASVVDEASFSTFYRRIGHSSQGVKAFDTDGARLTGIRVRDELLG